MEQKLKYVSYEEASSRAYLILKLRKLIKEWKDISATTNDEYFLGMGAAAVELETLIKNLVPEL